MTTSMLSDETLMAYVDGELPDVEAAASPAIVRIIPVISRPGPVGGLSNSIPGGMKTVLSIAGS